MQPLLLFFIDGANLIDSKEPEWDMLLAVHTKGDIVTVVSGQHLASTSTCSTLVTSHRLCLLSPFLGFGTMRGVNQTDNDSANTSVYCGCAEGSLHVF